MGFHNSITLLYNPKETHKFSVLHVPRNVTGYSFIHPYCLHKAGLGISDKFTLPYTDREIILVIFQIKMVYHYHYHHHHHQYLFYYYYYHIFWYFVYYKNESVMQLSIIHEMKLDKFLINHEEQVVLSGMCVPWALATLMYYMIEYDNKNHLCYTTCTNN